MAYLDVDPTIRALREHPDQFQFKFGSLHHPTSRHRFEFTEKEIRIDAHCDCAVLKINPEKEAVFRAAYETWRTEYWVPREINENFASHFTPPWILRLKAWLQAFPSPLHS